VSTFIQLTPERRGARLPALHLQLERMETEFRRVDVGKEIRSLIAFDRKVFPPSDVFDSATWRSCKAYWLLVQGKTVGCCAFEENVDFADDQTGGNTPMHGSLYIATTGILESHRGKGLGDLMKAWQIAYARHYGFNRLVTNMRRTNVASLKLNKKYGFTRLRVTASYYHDPDEATLVMERWL
jgi:ribosomal protein S18 acetylase RimI-like enzyme